MRAQAKYCTKREIRWLNHWRHEGYTLTIDEPIPMCEFTPPSLATRRPVLDALVGAAITVAAILMGGMWLASGAGLMR